MGSDGGGGGAGVVATVGGTVADVAGGGVTTGARVEAVVATPPTTIVDDAFETVGATTVVLGAGSDAVFVTEVDVIVDAMVDDVVGLDDVMVSIDVESSLCTATLPSTSTATTSLDAEPHAPSAVATTIQCHFTA